MGTTQAEVLTGQQGEALKKQFKAAVDACSKVLTMPQPVVDEPVIPISTGSQKTYDPCSLVSDLVLHLAQMGLLLHNACASSTQFFVDLALGPLHRL